MLTERKKADRAEMARRVVALAIELGAEATALREPTFLGPRASIVRIKAPGGLELSLDFDGKSTQPDTFVLSWVVRGDAKLVAHFAPSVNTCHWGKATDVCGGFDCLLSILSARLIAARDGWAYQGSDHP